MLKIINLLKLLLCGAVAFLSVNVIVHPDVSNHLIVILVGLIGLLIAFNSNTIDSLKFIDNLRKDFKMIEIQDFILREIKNNNTQVIGLITSQADLLSKMTSIAIKKEPDQK